MVVTLICELFNTRRVGYARLSKIFCDNGLHDLEGLRDSSTVYRFRNSQHVYLFLRRLCWLNSIMFTRTRSHSTLFVITIQLESVGKFLVQFTDVLENISFLFIKTLLFPHNGRVAWTLQNKTFLARLFDRSVPSSLLDECFRVRGLLALILMYEHLSRMFVLLVTLRRV